MLNNWHICSLISNCGVNNKKALILNKLFVYHKNYARTNHLPYQQPCDFLIEVIPMC